jgi:Thioredoxin
MRAWHVVAIVAAVLLYVPSTSALYSSSSPVKALDEKNFDSTLRNGAWVVEFYAPWCEFTTRVQDSIR